MARAAEQKTDRRSDISKALYRCISRQGYACTTLTDIAEEAKMSPSHIGYYFDNKAAILEFYSVRLCQQIEAGMPDLNEPDLERLIDAIVTFTFGKGQLNNAFLGVIQELRGLSVHDAGLHKIKSAHAITWRKYLETFFARTEPANGLTTGEAARLIHAILVGLETNTLFDCGLSVRAARDLFRNALRNLSGLVD